MLHHLSEVWGSHIFVPTVDTVILSLTPGVFFKCKNFSNKYIPEFDADCDTFKYFETFIDFARQQKFLFKNSRDFFQKEYSSNELESNMMLLCNTFENFEALMN